MQIMNIYSRSCTFSTLTVTSKLPTFKTDLAWVTRACCLQPLVFLRVWVIVPFLRQRPQFFPRVGVIMNLKRFDLLFDNKLSVVRLYLFVLFCFFLLFVEEQRWSIRVLVLLDPSRLFGKKSAERWGKHL